MGTNDHLHSFQDTATGEPRQANGALSQPDGKGKTVFFLSRIGTTGLFWIIHASPPFDWLVLPCRGSGARVRRNHLITEHVHAQQG